MQTKSTYPNETSYFILNIDKHKVDFRLYNQIGILLSHSKFKKMQICQHM